jgi:hypothetical protein
MALEKDVSFLNHSITWEILRIIQMDKYHYLEFFLARPLRKDILLHGIYLQKEYLSAENRFEMGLSCLNKLYNILLFPAWLF